MANLILCSRKRAAHPFYISSIGKNIYSMEELCYVFFHHTILIDETLINENLCEWIYQELYMDKLYEKLKELSLEGASLKMFVHYIFQSVQYCTEKECGQVLDYIEKIESMSSWERQKLRGDFLIQDRQFQAAIDLYSDLLERRREQRSRGIVEEAKMLTASVFHNMGVAYANLGFFSEAAMCLKTAYQMNESFESCLEFLYLTEKAEGPIAREKEMAEVPFDESQLRMTLEQRLETAKKKMENAVEQREKKKQEAQKPAISKRVWEERKELQEKIEVWKQEFRSMTGIG